MKNYIYVAFTTRVDMWVNGIARRRGEGADARLCNRHVKKSILYSGMLKTLHPFLYSKPNSSQYSILWIGD